jgi:hypothetical protein
MDRLKFITKKHNNNLQFVLLTTISKASKVIIQWPRATPQGVLLLPRQESVARKMLVMEVSIVPFTKTMRRCMSITIAQVRMR